MTLTPNHVRNVRFSRPRAGELGYDEHDVDAFLERVHAALTGQDALTADDVRAVRFAPARHGNGGYSANAVDVFLVEVRLTLARRLTGARDTDRRRRDVASAPADARPSGGRHRR
ncbi:DivIVA domain-containing protein [Gandjariella thermophila]|uniref:Antigen 84 n=1 Tax=Gandjariella thermophila TaxID=1931992 RepID=A0A4D4JGC6_9PSEU|nr:DivIVA domain-containing protein [Gandjariella thermophila]GDY33698.1 hypothetical protein GTS_53310 [Gandjariella thermophila]